MSTVTAIGTDAAQVVDAAEGGSRGWESEDPGFDPNDIDYLIITNAAAGWQGTFQGLTDSGLDEGMGLARADIDELMGV